MKTSESVHWQIQVPRPGSVEQAGGEGGQVGRQPASSRTEHFIELLQEVNNSLAAVLINAQVLDGKLPSYSRSKRYIHEIERSAQRGGAILKRLLERLPAAAAGNLDGEFASATVPPVAERIVVASQGPDAVAEGVPLAPSAAADAAPDFASAVDAHRRV